MENISIADLNYLLFVLPGFVLIWSYRVFTKAPKMGEFEYAAWSFVWGLFFMMALFGIGQVSNHPLPNFPLNSPAIDGVVAALVPLAIFIGYLAAIVYRMLHLGRLYEWLVRMVKED